MKITATATMKGENEVTVRISAAFQGAENTSGGTQAKARDSFKATFSDSSAAGFIWNAAHMAYESTCAATPEACAPIMAYCEKKNIEIIQM
ncbi:MAG: hypothetical protein WC261_11975 [Synergistaceae bacterium]|jgi:hypothetical protein